MSLGHGKIGATLFLQMDFVISLKIFEIIFFFKYNKLLQDPLVYALYKVRIGRLTISHLIGAL